MSMSEQQLRARAEQFRTEHNLPATGFVIVCGDEPGGWTADLGRPHRWTPGCVAVPVGEQNQDPMYAAEGGDASRGADTWRKLTV